MKTNYFRELKNIFSGIKVSDARGRILAVSETLNKLTRTVLSLRTGSGKIILIGNGGSASIASHIATDFLKNCRIPALTFNDAILQTCVSNDLGFDSVFSRPLEMLAKKGDIVFSVSSSGKSQNILKASALAKKKGCYLITLSGFGSDNPLRKSGDINFYVPSDSYGYVEIAHLAICHSIVDAIMKKIYG